jgi:NAD+ kinase
MAAGGSIVHPQVDAILVTPICSHSLTTRPLVLPGDKEVEIEIEGKIEEPSVFLTIDGQTGFSLQAGDRVTINTSSRYLSFAKSPSRSYFEVLATKLKWASQ